MSKYVVAFESTHGAISSRRVLEKIVTVRTIPVPRSLSAACGIALVFEGEDNLPLVEQKMKGLDMEGEYSIHKMEV